MYGQRLPAVRKNGSLIKLPVLLSRQFKRSYVRRPCEDSLEIVECMRKLSIDFGLSFGGIGKHLEELQGLPDSRG